jgi:hypothetical protein
LVRHESRRQRQRFHDSDVLAETAKVLNAAITLDAKLI